MGNADLVPQTSHDLTADISENSNVLISEKTHIVKIVTLKSEPVRSNRAHFDVRVKNRLDERFFFAPRHISVEIEQQEKPLTWAPLKIFSYPELKAEADERNRMNRLAAAIGGLGRVAQAYRGGTYAGSDYSKYSRYDALQQADRHNDFEKSYYDSQQQDDVAKLKMYMEGQYVASDRWYGGLIEVDAPDPQGTPMPLRVHVQVGDETHTFTYLLQRPTKKTESKFR